MSRIGDGEVDCTEDFLRNCAFWGNARRSAHGRNGQEILRELEAALLELPEKRLAHGVFIRKEEKLPSPPEDPPVTLEGEVCALGCLALHRKLKSGKTRQQALTEMAEQVPEDMDAREYEDPVKRASQALQICLPLGYLIVEANDEGGDPKDPARTYQKVLAWVQQNIHRGPAYWGKS